MNSTTSKGDKNAQFYELIKELFDSHTLVFEKLQAIEGKIDSLAARNDTQGRVRIPKMRY